MSIRRRSLVAALPLFGCAEPALPDRIIAVSAAVEERDAQLVERHYSPVVEETGMRWPGALRAAAMYREQAWNYELALERPATEADARAFEAALRQALNDQRLAWGTLQVAVAAPRQLAQR